MKKEWLVKTLAFGVVVLLFVGISILPCISTISINNDVSNKRSISCIKTYAQTAKYKSYELCFMDDDYFNNTDNIVVTNTTGDESYPTLVVSGYYALVAYEHEYENNTHVYLRNSVNCGQSWSSGYVGFSSQFNSFSPSLSIKPFSKTAYCAAVSDYNNSCVLFDVEIPNIDNINLLYTYLIDWGPFGFYNFSNPDIVYYSDPSYPNVPFMTTVIGSTTYAAGPCKNTPMFFYRCPDNPSCSTIAWDTAIQNCSNLSVSFDYIKKIFYGVCEIKNETKTNILFFYDNPIYWWSNSSLKHKILTGEENLTHPQIFYTEKQIYITTETETNGIIIYNSSNGGNTWYLHNVTKDIMPFDAKPKYPILYADQNIVYCIFTESGNISITNSSDYGNSWDSPIQLNNQNSSVVEGYKFHDIPDADHVVWTDNREGKNDIYSSLLNVPKIIDIMVVPDSIKITTGEYPKLPTKNWITFTIKNNGNIYIENVTVEINYTCQNITKSTNYPVNISYLDVGFEKIFYQPLFKMKLIEFLQALRNFAGIQNITVTVDPYKKYNDFNFDDNSVTVEVKYLDIFPRLYFLEKIYLI